MGAATAIEHHHLTMCTGNAQKEGVIHHVAFAVDSLDVQDLEPLEY
jgi:hypothetical protein